MKEEELKKIDMLPMIKNKIDLAPEKAPLFAKKGGRPKRNLRHYN